MARNHTTQQSTNTMGWCLLRGVMTMATNLIQEVQFSYLRVSKKCVIFDLFPFCWSTYHYSYPSTICMSLKDVYERRIMPLLEGNDMGLALPRQFSLFFGTSWFIDSGGFWGYYLNSHLEPSIKTNNTTINKYMRADSICWGWKWHSFWTNRPWFS